MGWSPFYDTPYELNKIIDRSYFNQKVNTVRLLVEDEEGNQAEETIEYINQKVKIKDPSFSSDVTQKEAITLTARLEDPEDDRVQYRILLNGAKIFPSNSEWSSFQNSGHILTYSFAYPDLNIGSNTITLIAKDEINEEEAVWTRDLEVVNEAPYIFSITNDDFSLTAIIKDEDDDKVGYRISINGEQVFPAEEGQYTELAPQPLNVKYGWRSSDLIFGEENEIKIEITDQMGATLEKTIIVVGSYEGLMFKDTEDRYYTTDQGDLLRRARKELLVGGQTSVPKKIIVENRNPFTIRNLLITVEPNNFDYVDKSLSKNDTPFIGASSILFEEQIEPYETREFFVRVSTEKYAQGAGDSKICAYANLV